MRILIKYLFFLLLPIFSYGLDSTTNLDQLLHQKNRDAKWYDDFANELVKSKGLNAENVGKYANSILQDKSLKLNSEQRIRMVRSFVIAYDKLGAYDRSILVINSYLSALGKAGYSDQFAYIWFDLIYDYNSLSKIDSVKYVVETTKQFIKDKSPNYYYWLLANSVSSPYLVLFKSII